MMEEECSPPARVLEQLAHTFSPAGDGEWQQRELCNLLNSSPGVTRAIARRHAGDCVRMSDVLEMATVKEVHPTGLVVELTLIDMALIDESSTCMPRRTLTTTIPLPWACTDAHAVEDAIIRMLDTGAASGVGLGHGLDEIGI